MAYNTNFTQSNKADFVAQFTATDAETGDAIDFTGAEISIAIKDKDGCLKYSASIGSGIEQPDANTIELTIPVATMNGFCSGTYQIGGVYELNDETNQIFVGDFVVYDGIASL